MSAYMQDIRIHYAYCDVLGEIPYQIGKIHFVLGVLLIELLLEYYIFAIVKQKIINC